MYKRQADIFSILYDLAHHVAGWEPYNLHDKPMSPGLDLYYADPAQPLTTAGEELDDSDRYLSDLSGV